MINLNPFKKEVQGAISIVAEPKTGYPEIVQRIHKDFDTAGERLLAEANSIVEKNADKDTLKGERLMGLGFGKSREAQEAKQVKADLKMGSELADVIQYFNFHYPNNKYITDAEVKVICEKYGLVVGETTDYIGFVPEKNLRDIEKFKLREEDHVYFKKYTSIWSNEYMITSKRDYEISHPVFENGQCMYDYNYEWKINHRTICAPVKDFDMEGKELDGHKIKDIKLDDPIVLQTVYRNGIKGNLIITAWGDEASDPIVVNHKMN